MTVKSVVCGWLTLVVMATQGCAGGPTGTTAATPGSPVPERAGSIHRIDPGLDRVLSPAAELELLGEHFGVIEGPLWIANGGYLLFSDMAANVIYKRTPDGQVSVFMEKSGFTGSDVLNAGAQSTSGRLAVILIGSNGLTLDPQGRLLIAAMADRAVARIESDGSRTILADRHDGRRFNGPNDLVARSDGAIYFTDMTAGMRGRDKSPFREMPFTGVYLIRNGTVTLLDKDPAGGMPNGIALSPDEQTLYVGSAGKILRYDIRDDHTIDNRRVLIDASTDGMKVDATGHLFLTHRGEVWIVSPEGRHLGSVRLPQIPGVATTNVAFGDADGKTLYITARTHLFRIRLETTGILPRPKS